MTTTYNFLNLTEVAREGGSERLKTVYDATGRKWKKESILTVDGDEVVTTQLYVGAFEFEQGEDHPMRLASINGHEDGRSVQDYAASTTGDIVTRVEYYHKDHLGECSIKIKKELGTIFLKELQECLVVENLDY